MDKKQYFPEAHIYALLCPDLSVSIYAILPPLFPVTCNSLNIYMNMIFYD